MEFWKYVGENLGKLQNTQHSVRELVDFLVRNNVDEQADLSECQDYANLSEETKCLVTANDYLHQIDERLAILIGVNYIQIPDASLALMGDVPDNAKVQPVVVRYELTLTTGDPELFDTINELYQIYKKMVSKREITIAPDWLITKFRQSVVLQNLNPLAQQRIIKPLPLDNSKFILEVEKINNKIELILFVETSGIRAQEDIENLRSNLLLYIDFHIGEYRSYVYMNSITILPINYYEEVSQNFPDYYQLRDWSEFSTRLIEIIPKPQWCQNCFISEDNTEIVEITESPHVHIPAGIYCTYCFKLLSRLVFLSGPEAPK
jgi:hypothetical protein